MAFIKSKHSVNETIDNIVKNVFLIQLTVATAGTDCTRKLALF